MARTWCAPVNAGRTDTTREAQGILFPRATFSWLPSFFALCCRFVFLGPWPMHAFRILRLRRWAELWKWFAVTRARFNDAQHPNAYVFRSTCQGFEAIGNWGGTKLSRKLSTDPDQEHVRSHETLRTSFSEQSKTSIDHKAPCAVYTTRGCPEVTRRWNWPSCVKIVKAK